MDPRWLNPEQAAAYIGMRVDQLPRAVRAGKLPKPSLHLGPRSPRYDRVALDSLFLANAPAAGVDIEVAEQEWVDAINKRADSKAQASGRNGQRVPIRPNAVKNSTLGSWLR